MRDQPLTPTQCRMARSALRWTLDDLAEASGVSRPTVARFEGGGSIKPSTAAHLREAFEAKGMTFVDDGPMAGAVVPPLRPA